VKSKDLFLSHAGHYARYRPSYPSELFAHITNLCLDRELAWDCATGNGQAAIGLTKLAKDANGFQNGIATDLCKNQLAEAKSHTRITYRVAPAHQRASPIPQSLS
jgi:hypothetical protein